MKKSVLKKTSLIVLGVVSTVIYLNRVESASGDDVLTANVEVLASGESGSGGGCGTGTQTTTTPGEPCSDTTKKEMTQIITHICKEGFSRSCSDGVTIYKFKCDGTASILYDDLKKTNCE